MERKQLPVAALVIAILHFVGAGFSMCCMDLPGLAVQLAGGATGIMERFVGPGHPSLKEVKSMEEHLHKEMPFQAVYTYFTAICGILLSLAMVLAGIGLLRRQQWGRYLSFFYAVCSIMLNLLKTSYMAIFLAPAQASLYQGRTDLPPGFADSQRLNGYFSAAFNLVFIIYPIVVLILLNLPAVRQSFQNSAEEA